MEPIQFKPNAKQAIALNYLLDGKTKQLLYGGSAGNGKSFLGCAWLIIMCIKYPGTRYLMGRSILKSLKESTLNTFFEICVMWRLQKAFTYNAQDGKITFINKSEILLKDLAFNPSDPEYMSLGSTEFTGAFIDEAGQVMKKAKDIVYSRIRFKLDENKLIPKLFMTTNPAKTWCYHEFYAASRNNTLQEGFAFVQALPADNPYLSKHYLDSLAILDEISKQRLLYGNWDYEQSPGKLYEFSKILDLFTNKPVNGLRCISGDVARFGRDKAVYLVWDGWEVIDYKVFEKASLIEQQEAINVFAKKYKIQPNNIVIDEDGLGGGLLDLLECKGIVNNSSPVDTRTEIEKYQEKPKPNFQNLKTQLYFAIKPYIDNNIINLSKLSQYKEEIIQELDIVAQKDIDKDGKKCIIGKDEIKEKIGRSPDFADAIVYRLFFDIHKIQQEEDDETYEADYAQAFKQYLNK